MFRFLFHKLPSRPASFFISSHVFRFYASDSSHVQFVDWSNTNKFQFDKQFVIKKQERPSEIKINSLEYSLLKSNTIALDDIFSYSEKVFYLYKSWLAAHKRKEVMDHFETQLLVFNFYHLSLYMRAAEFSKQFHKAIEMYEKYIHLFDNNYTIYAVLCYLKLGNEAKALELLKLHKSKVTEVDLNLLFSNWSLTDSVLEYILEEPTFESRLSLADLENTLQLKRFIRFKDKLKQKIETISKQGGMYTEIFEKFKSKLEEYKQNPSTFDVNALLEMRQLFSNKDNFYELFPSYLYLAQQQLSSEQFFEFLMSSVIKLLTKRELKQAIQIISNYTLPLELRERFFVKYMTRCVEANKNELEIMKPWFDKNEILKQFLENPTNVKFRDDLLRYYLILGEYENAKRVIDSSSGIALAHPFGYVLEYLYTNKMPEQYIFLFQHGALNIPNAKIHKLHMARYVKLLSILGDQKELLNFYNHCKSVNIELSQITLLLLMQQFSETNMTLFAEAFQEFVSRPVEPHFTFDARILSRIIKNLNQKRNQQHWIREVDEKILQRCALEKQLSSYANDIVSKTKLPIDK